MYQKLVSFLTNNFTDKEELLKVIRCSNLRLLTLDFTKTIDSVFYQESNVLKFKQKILNKLFLSEIRSFLSDCASRNLYPVFLKGLFTAFDLYQEPDTRISTDIDILIRVKELSLYTSIFEKNGYELSNKYNYIASDPVKMISLMHLVFLKRTGGQEICFEVHGSAINPPVIFKDFSEEFAENVERVDILGLRPCLLTKEYNLIFLMLHFFKHLPNLYFSNMLLYKEVKVNLSNIHDIALFINKYHKTLDWYKIISVSKRMLVVKYIYLVSSIVRDIYGNIISGDFLSELKANIKYSYLASTDLENLGMGKYLWLFNNVMDQITELSAADILKGKLPQTIDLIKITQNSESRILKFKNNYDLTVDFVLDFVHKDENTNFSTNIPVSINTSIRKDMLSLVLQVQNKACCYYEKDGYTYHKDGIEVILIRPSGILHRMFTLAKKGEEVLLLTSSHNMDQTALWEEGSGLYRLTADDNGFLLELTIPWTYFGMDSIENNFIPLEIAALISNPVTHLHYKACNLFHNTKKYLGYPRYECNTILQIGIIYLLGYETSNQGNSSD